MATPKLSRKELLERKFGKERIEEFKIKNYFLLGVTPPQIWKLVTEKGFTKIAGRFSEWELPSLILGTDWVWVDTFTRNPLLQGICGIFKRNKKKTCLVCPDRWGRPKDINKYKKYFKENNIKIDAVMTSMKFAEKWE